MTTATRRIRIDNILSAVDFSEHSDQASAYAVSLARWCGASLTLLHAFQSLPWYGVPRAGSVSAEPIPVPSESDVPILVDPPARQIAQDRMRHLVESLELDGLSVQTEVEEGDPVERLVHQAERLPADLVVLGTHGRRGFERWMLGSVTERALRSLPCPVMTVPRSVATPPEPETLFKNVVCPVDFSEASMAALEYALSLAEEADGRLAVLHVVDELTITEEARAFTVQDHRRYLQEDASKRLHAAVPEEARTYCAPLEVVVAGKAYPEILRVAREHQAHLIVMGTHGRGAMGRMFLGSTTNHVVREAPCPVLTLRVP